MSIVPITPLEPIEYLQLLRVDLETIQPYLTNSKVPIGIVKVVHQLYDTLNTLATNMSIKP